MRRRNPAPQYIESLENRLQRAEALLKSFVPNIDPNDPNLDASIAARLLTTSNQSPQAAVLNPSKGASNSDLKADDQEAKLQSMILSTGQLQLDDRGHWDFHGGSSGAVFLWRLRERFGDLMADREPGTAPFLPRPPMPRGMAATYDSANSYELPIEPGLPNTADLPSRETARGLCSNALNCACAILRPVHAPTFWEFFEKIYDTPPGDYGDEENRFLAVLYVACATGCMFETLPDERDQQEWIYKAGIDRGLKYFRAARKMMDITDCRDLTSLQAILFMIIFLQASANLSTCYSYIGIALRSALRLGLHRNLTGDFNPIERETRKRVFWTIRKMDTYVSCLLGFPKMLCEEDIDQPLPTEVDDEYITIDGILPMPEGKISFHAASNAHSKLMFILTKVIRYIYSIKGLDESTSPTSYSYSVSHARIREVEHDLQDWLGKLPMGLKPAADASPEVLRVQQLLRMAYAHVQMMLYRPFLHYVSEKSCAGKTIDERSYACAAASVSVSRNIVHITVEMKRRGLLIGAYWSAIYTTFFAVISLVFFVLENPNEIGSKEILADATAGRNAIVGLAKRSLAANRCADALVPLFEKLPQRLKGRTEGVKNQKKRRAPETGPGHRQGAESSPDLNATPGQNASDQKLPGATTFPANTATPTGCQATVPDSSLHQSYLVSQKNISGAGTPDSASTKNSILTGQNHQEPQAQVIPDLTAMMFPSTDPFAYPNQPMMEFDNFQQKRQVVDNIIHGGAAQKGQDMFLMGNGIEVNNNPTSYDNLERPQFFGPSPPHLLGNDINNEIVLSRSRRVDPGGLNGFANPMLEMNGLFLGLTPNGGGSGAGGLNFNETLGTTTEWNEYTHAP